MSQKKDGITAARDFIFRGVNVVGFGAAGYLCMQGVLLFVSNGMVQ